MARSWRDIADTVNQTVVKTYGETVTYTPIATGTPETVVLHFEASHHSFDFEDGISRSTDKPHAFCRVADLSAHPEPGDTIVAQGKTYRVEVGEVDGYGAVKLWLVEVS